MELFRWVQDIREMLWTPRVLPDDAQGFLSREAEDFGLHAILLLSEINEKYRKIFFAYWVENAIAWLEKVLDQLKIDELPDSSPEEMYDLVKPETLLGDRNQW